jgi:hypothetical protein
LLSQQAVIDAVDWTRWLAYLADDGLFPSEVLWNQNVVLHHLAFFFMGLAVFAAALKAASVGAPLLPGLRMRSGVLPAAFWRSMRSRLADVGVKTGFHFLAFAGALLGLPAFMAALRAVDKATATACF